MTLNAHFDSRNVKICGGKNSTSTAMYLGIKPVQNSTHLVLWCFAAGRGQVGLIL